MMSWFARDKQARQRLEHEREALARSIEDLAKSDSSTHDSWIEEEQDVGRVVASRSTLIPPVLKLQSRAMPVVSGETTKQEADMPDRDSPGTWPGRRLGHSTRVRLQAVRPTQECEPTTERVPIVDPSGAGSGEQNQALVRKVELPATTTQTLTPLALFGGSGIIEEGQAETTVHNPRISAQSVITAMLAGNPGPVVVHYISLQPRAGFTLHLSAPVSARTPFNYAVWLF